MQRIRSLSVRLVAFAGALAAFAPPAQAQVCTPFTDVAAGDPFCTSIQWMFNRGITLGCTASQYCPGSNVRRDQMAAFMFRLGNVVHQQGGNAFGATAVLGTTDDQPLDVRVNGGRAMRFEPNAISPNVVGGSAHNSVETGVRGATIAGGGVATGADEVFVPGSPNLVVAHYGTVGGGYANRAGTLEANLAARAFATVGGGATNAAGGFASTVGGGVENAATNTYATIAGGLRNSALAEGGAIGGGETNTVDGFGLAATIAGGRGNTVSGGGSAVGGGMFNVASGNGSTVSGGLNNAATGQYGTVGGGEGNLASGQYSFAAGRRAKSDTAGSFTWADSTNLDFGPSVANFFAVRATGGAGFTVAVNPSTGVSTQFCNYLPGTTGWSCVSDREQKENMVPADGTQVLERLLAMPVYGYNFKGAPASLRNLGPTAQDFRAAFGLGESDLTIASGNLDGVALAAIQGLNAKLERRIAAQADEIAALRERVAEVDLLRAELAAMRAAFAQRPDAPETVATP